MSTTLFKKEFKNNLLLLGIFCLVLTLYITMIISMFDPALSKSIEAMRESMPEIFALVGMSAPGVTLLDFIVNYLFGFLFKLFPMIFFFILVNRMLIRYIDRGTMAYLLATPNSRIKIVGTQALSICFELFLLLAYICLLVIIISEFMFPGALDLPLFLFTIVGLFGLLLFMSSIAFLCGCIFHEASKALGIGIGINILFLLIQMISQVGEKFEWLKYATPLTLYDPIGIAANDSKSFVLVLPLYICAIAFYSLGLFIFQKKDLCI